MPLRSWGGVGLAIRRPEPPQSVWLLERPHVGVGLATDRRARHVQSRDKFSVVEHEVAHRVARALRCEAARGTAFDDLLAEERRVAVYGAVLHRTGGQRGCAPRLSSGAGLEAHSRTGGVVLRPAARLEAFRGEGPHVLPLTPADCHPHPHFQCRSANGRFEELTTG